MEIKTKYNIGDKVYFMHLNKVQQGIVKRIDIGIWEEFEEIKFDVHYVNGLQRNCTMWFNESEIFPSKEELLNSL